MLQGVQLSFEGRGASKSVKASLAPAQASHRHDINIMTACHCPRYDTRLMSLTQCCVNMHIRAILTQAEHS